MLRSLSGNYRMFPLILNEGQHFTLLSDGFVSRAHLGLSQGSYAFQLSNNAPVATLATLLYMNTELAKTIDSLGDGSMSDFFRREGTT